MLYIVTVVVFIGCSSGSTNLDSDEKVDSTKSTTYGEIAKLSESSGICYSSGSDTLFIACDNGFIHQMSKNGDILNTKDFSDLKNHDFEGISYDAISDFLFVAIEGSDNVLVLDRDLKTQKTINVEREDALGRVILEKDDENGLEGIAIDQRGEIYLANQSFNRLPSNDPSVIIQIDLLSAEIKEVIDLEYLNISGLSFYQEYLYMVSDTNNLLIKYDISNSTVISSTKVKSFSSDLINASIEGVAFDNEENIYFTDDESGAVFKYKFSE